LILTIHQEKRSIADTGTPARQREDSPATAGVRKLRTPIAAVTEKESLWASENHGWLAWRR
jgi:hypothetical protein